MHCSSCQYRNHKIFVLYRSYCHVNIFHGRFMFTKFTVIISCYIVYRSNNLHYIVIIVMLTFFMNFTNLSSVNSNKQACTANWKERGKELWRRKSKKSQIKKENKYLAEVACHLTFISSKCQLMWKTIKKRVYLHTLLTVGYI